MNCFTALKQVFKNEWENPANNVLWKTTGYGAIIKAFPYLHERGVDKKDLSENYFYECFNNLKSYMEIKEKDFSNKFYAGGGEQLQQKLADYIRHAQKN